VLKEIKDIEARGDVENPRYMELLKPNFYQQHLCRLKEWPDGFVRSLKHTNGTIYTMMQGPSEFGISGRLRNWDRKADLKNIRVPTLMVGAKYDTMDPKAMEDQSRMVQNGSYLYCPNGSHLSMWDDQQVFMSGVIRFINNVAASN
jgi:proline iminopeptidase